MSLRARIAAGAGALVIVFVAAIVYAYSHLADIARKVVETQFEGMTFQDLEVGWNSLTVEGVRIDRGKENVLKVETIAVEPSLISVFTDTFRVARVHIEKPYVVVVRRRDGSLRLPTPQPRDKGKKARNTKGAKQKPKADDKDPSKPLRISIDQITIANGKGKLNDFTVGRRPATFVLADVEVEVEHVAVPMKGRIPFDVALTLQAKRPASLELEGWYDPTTASADVELEVDDLFLPKAEPYYKTRATTVSATDGVLDLEIDVTMEKGAYVAETELGVADIAFEKEGLFLGIPSGVLKKYLDDQSKRFDFAVTIEGSLEDGVKLQSKLVAALANALITKIGKERLNGVAKELGEKALGEASKSIGHGAAQKAERAVKGLFGK